MGMGRKVTELHESISALEDDINRIQGTNYTFVALLGYNALPGSIIYQVNTIQEIEDKETLEFIEDRLYDLYYSLV